MGLRRTTLGTRIFTLAMLAAMLPASVSWGQLFDLGGPLGGSDGDKLKVAAMILHPCNTRNDDP